MNGLNDLNDLNDLNELNELNELNAPKGEPAIVVTATTFISVGKWAGARGSPL